MSNPSRSFLRRANVPLAPSQIQQHSCSPALCRKAAQIGGRDRPRTHQHCRVSLPRGHIRYSARPVRHPEPHFTVTSPGPTNPRPSTPIPVGEPASRTRKHCSARSSRSSRSPIRLWDGRRTGRTRAMTRGRATTATGRTRCPRNQVSGSRLGLGCGGDQTAQHHPYEAAGTW